MPDVLPQPSVYSDVLADCASATRHDGWTREVKVTFCEVLAITGRVIEALDAVNRSGNTAYAQRRRDPLFAAAWELGLTQARQRLADALLERALDGNLFVTYDARGMVISERRIHDNRLALAVLRRLDRIAETGRATVARRPAHVPAAPVAALAGKEPPPANLAEANLAADQLAADQATGDAAPTEPALATYDEALARLAAAPDTLGARSAFDPDPDLEAEGEAEGEAGETHETHKGRSHSDTLRVMGDARTPLREVAGQGPVGNRSECTLSFMN